MNQKLSPLEILAGTGIITGIGLLVLSPFAIAYVVGGIVGFTWLLIVAGVLIMAFVIGAIVISALDP